MKRWLLRVVVFLILAAIVNVAVAWGAFVTWQMDSASNKVPATGSPDETALWGRHSSAGWPSRPATREYESNLLADIESLDHLAFNENGSERFGVKRVRCGFPMRSFTWEQWNGSPWDKQLARTSGDDGMRIGGITLPRVVLATGFVVDTIVFALIIWLPFSGPLAARRRWRIHRGLCPKCAYDLRGTPEGSTACPECGGVRGQ